MSAIRQGRLPSASLEAGAFRGSLKHWLPPRVTDGGHAAFERDVAQARIDDLYANDGIAKSGVNSVAAGVIGTGLTPQSAIPAECLGLDREAVAGLQDKLEWLWAEWCADAHYGGRMSFAELQRLALLSLVRNGEFLHLPLRESSPGRRFDLRIQDIRPARLRTPWDRRNDPLLRDGVEISAAGVPVAYWIADPSPAMMALDSALFVSGDFRRIPARIGHMRGIFHVFRPESEEQFRGVSPLAPVVKFFRHLNDSIDYELMAQVLAAAFPVFIGLENPQQALPGYVEQEADAESGEKRYYQEIPAGGVMYGNPGEKPEILESKRPSANFLNFCELILHVLGAALEIPYEVLTRDFTKTTYSSARAALMEAWRVYEIYRAFMVRHYCQPVWEMVLEEAWLRGWFELPPGAPDFYEARAWWCNARWIGPARGYLDPVKEIRANLEAIDGGLMSRSEAIAERGGDFNEVTDQLAAEKARRDELGLVSPPPDAERSAERVEERTDA